MNRQDKSKVLGFSYLDVKHGRVKQFSGHEEILDKQCKKYELLFTPMFKRLVYGVSQICLDSRIPKLSCRVFGGPVNQDTYEKFMFRRVIERAHDGYAVCLPEIIQFTDEEKADLLRASVFLLKFYYKADLTKISKITTIGLFPKFNGLYEGEIEFTNESKEDIGKLLIVLRELNDEDRVNFDIFYKYINNLCKNKILSDKEEIKEILSINDIESKKASFVKLGYGISFISIVCLSVFLYNFFKCLVEDPIEMQLYIFMYILITLFGVVGAVFAILDTD